MYDNAAHIIEWRCLLWCLQNRQYSWLLAMGTRLRELVVRSYFIDVETKLSTFSFIPPKKFSSRVISIVHPAVIDLLYRFFGFISRSCNTFSSSFGGRTKQLDETWLVEHFRQNLQCSPLPTPIGREGVPQLLLLQLTVNITKTVWTCVVVFDLPIPWQKFRAFASWSSRYHVVICDRVDFDAAWPTSKNWEY